MTTTCADCPAVIRATSVRCRACNLKRVGRPGWNRIGHRGLTVAERQARWRATHPERSRQVNAERKQAVRAMVANYKAERGCETCGIRDPRVLDLHHRDGENKEAAVSQMMYRCAWAKVQAEMDKCAVLCANCHRIEHAPVDITAQIATAGFFRAS